MSVLDSPSSCSLSRMKENPKRSFMCLRTSAVVLRHMNERFGFSFILLNEQQEGVTFAHEPLINAKTLALHLAPLMQPLNADAGFLFDADSDRVGIATEEGQAVSEEIMLPLIADYLLPRGAGKLIITNLSTSALVDEIAARHCGTVVRVPVGRQAAIDALASYRPGQGALAGQGTGAATVPEFRFVDG